jgi:hypothetical protein
VNAAGLDHARPYDLRHSFASLLLHEGQHVVAVARALGHDARLTLTRYGHVLDELQGTGHIDPEAESGPLERLRYPLSTRGPPTRRSSRNARLSGRPNNTGDPVEWS